MKLMTLPAILLAAVFAAQAHAEPAKTREQVKAELAEAIRTGDILAGGTSRKLKDLYPDLYPSAPKAAGKTREQVKDELAEAIHTGDIIVGESSRKLNEIRPDLYPSAAPVFTKTREQVKAELAEAIRTGDILSGSDTLAKLNELYPDRYRSEIRMAEKNGSNVQ